MRELKMNQLTIQDGRIFLDGKEIQCVEEFDLKNSTYGTAELSLKLLVDLESVRVGKCDRKCVDDCYQAVAKQLSEELSAAKQDKIY